jgi:hypothetical protein
LRWLRVFSHGQHLSKDRAALDEYTAGPALEAVEDSPLDAEGHISRYGPPQTFNVSANLTNGCAVSECKKQAGLGHCAACKSVLYCGRKHQTADRPVHRSICSKIKKAHTNLEKEERALRREEGDEIFEEGKGHFWLLHETRPYMRARFTLVEALLKVNTTSAVTAVLDHLLSMLQLCRGDNMGVRELVPALCLRLGHDQECYDFVKWWATTGQEDNYDWSDTDRPYLDVKGANVFEAVDFIAHKYSSLSHMVATTLLKIRLMMDLQSLQRARREAGPYVPQEILIDIQQHATSSVITGDSKILRREDQSPHILILGEQVRKLFMTIKQANEHFWPALITPGDNLKARPQLYGRGDQGEMQLTLQFYYNAWTETPGAIGAIEVLLKQ